ncbi:MAG: hypothetical protein K2R93_15975 [Gemmatimonadaceae bacterium]|nr:hypothetical protein [Gemmatimonadaceae bacterium]
MISRTFWFGRSLPLAVLVASSALRAVRDRRIVDTVHAGDARSEALHGYVGVEARADTAGGTAYREATGWVRYALTTFDDTEVTVSCTFAADPSANGARRFALVVEDSVIATPELAPAATPRTVDVLVPQALTRGKTNIAISIYARGGVTPPLRELRTVQDHNEHDLRSYLLGAPR